MNRAPMLAAIVALALAGCAASHPPIPGSVLRDCPQCPQLVIIPGGSTWIGAGAEEHQRERVPAAMAATETPAYAVTLARPLAIGRFEITRGEYAAYRAAQPDSTPQDCDVFDRQSGRWEQRTDRSWRNPGFDQTDLHPVVCVNWQEAHGYVTWLSQLTGKRYRLLTEAEWEYAARAGSSTARFWGDTRDEACQHANVSDLTRAEAQGIATSADITFQCRDGVIQTAEVGRYPPNRFGLHDIQGNVWEWTEDCYFHDYAGTPMDGTARPGGDCSKHMDRGGSWVNSPKYLRSAARHADLTTRRNDVLGLRVVRDLD